MFETISREKKIDPSERRQSFNDVNVKLFCCRYWMLEEWECMDLSVPFWRLYHNTLPGAEIIFQNVIIPLKEDQVVIIPPQTSFSTRLKNNGRDRTAERITGRPVREIRDLENLKLNGTIDHLFIHFNLGFPLDFVKTGVYSFDCDQTAFDLLKRIKKSCLDEVSTFGFDDCLRIKQLIIPFLLNLPRDIWKYGKIDQRIFNSMQYITKHLSDKMTNEELAAGSNMAANSFARLFKLNTGVSVQQYILKARIEKSCTLMHHTNKTIDEIAFDCGFSDRHHFSKVFKHIIKLTPAYYKKHLIMA